MTVAQRGEGSWLEETPSRLTGMADLICFPGAGAGASAFRKWSQRLPAFTRILACQLPGRESRIDECPADSLSHAARVVARAYIEREPRSRPLVLFGHSMGGVLAFEVARQLMELGREPAALVFTASEPPGPPRKANLGRKELTALLLAYGAENQDLVGHGELSDSLLPIVEGDIMLLRQHKLQPDGLALDVPAWLFSGSRDEVVPKRSVERWADHFSAGVSLAELPGGHHFPFRESREAVLACLSEILFGAVRRRKR